MADASGHPKSIIHEYYERLWNRWDLAVADTLISPDIVFRGSLGVTVSGREGFKEYVRSVQRAFPDFFNAVEQLIAEGEIVAARLTYTGTHRGELFGIPPTHKTVVYAGVAIFRIQTGQVVEGWVLGDLHGLLQQLGGDDVRSSSRSGA